LWWLAPEDRLSDVVRSIARSRQLVKISIALTATLIVAALFAVWILRQGEIADSVDEGHRLGVVLAEQTTRTIQGVDVALQETAESILKSGSRDVAALHGGFGGQDMHNVLVNRLADLPQAGSIVILDAAGHYVNTSLSWPPPDFSLADRSYVRHFVNTADRGPYISEPLAGRANGGLPTIILARALSAPDGTLLGVVFAGIKLEYFDTFFSRTGFSDGTGITILRDDGIFLVHFPAEKGLSGSAMPAASPWYEIVGAGGGYYRSPGISDGFGARMVSVHPLSAYHVVVDVTRLESAALARWRRQTMGIGVGVLTVTLGFAMLLVALTRQITMIEAAHDRVNEQVDATRRSEARLAAQSALLETTLEHMNQGLMMIDASGIVAVCNRRAVEILGLPPAMMLAQPHLDEVVEFQDLQGEFTELSERRLDLPAMGSDHAMYERRRPNGTVIDVRSAPLPGGGMVRTYADITARVAAEEMLGAAASHDQLTGLLNRNGFNTQRGAVLASARHDGGAFAVLCLDLDRFKAVNDTLGHDAGDQLLAQVAQRMREMTRPTDLVARLGGDEFAIVLPCSTFAAAEHVSQRLLDSIRRPFAIGGESVRIGVSIGLATYPADGATAEELLRNADAALYEAKAAGRDTWRAYASADGHRQRQRMALELDFRSAVATGQFSLVYQPICNSTSSLPVAFEALVRWNHPSRGTISPAEFIPIAEQTGLIIPLGRWIIETACAEAAAWAVPVRIGVNLSPAQFREGQLVSFIGDVLARTGLAATRLDLEVTEGLLIEDTDEVVKTMHALRSLGVRMVLDDFGTAHSNLSYLRGFPFEAVKIDQSFMRSLNTDRQARALVEAMLALANALGLEVIGEGVETPEQLALLRHLQCRLVQGYLLGRPKSSWDTREAVRRLAASQSGDFHPAHDLLPAVNA
jgi:diguanylate cyclase (GGDEF)-like protein/PAS domain S-box-containing protein